jgi:transcriptional regulator with XRE-family HTH domain
MQSKKRKDYDFDSIVKEFGERTKDLRIKKGLSQEDIAKILDIERSTASRLENGIIAPTFQNLILLSETLGTTIDYLLTGRKSMTLPDFGKFQEEIEQFLVFLSEHNYYKHRVLSDYYTKLDEIRHQQKETLK